MLCGVSFIRLAECGGSSQNIGHVSPAVDTSVMSRDPPRICKVTFERNACNVGIGQSRPKLSWRFAQDSSTVTNFKQSAYELSFTRKGNTRTYRVESSQSISEPWPSEEEGLTSREIAQVGVRVCGNGAEWTEWFSETVEAALLSPDDWKAEMITSDFIPPASMPKRPMYLRTSFELSEDDLGTFYKQAPRIYATAFGVYELCLNGERIGDHVLAPGWQAYQHRLHYQTYPIPSGVLRAGTNVLGITVGEGWYAGRLTWIEGCRNYWGERIGAMCQMQVASKTITTNTKDWKWSYGPLISGELYDGEVFDTTVVDPDWCRPSTSLSTSSQRWNPTESLQIPSTTKLIAPEAPPIRRIEEIAAVDLITTPSGGKVIDFGQNIAGWVRVKIVPKCRGENYPEFMTIQHAEVLNKGDLEIKALRLAKATDTIFMSSEPYENYEPHFTTHGFRYIQVKGCEEVDKDNFIAVVVHSDMERLGDFSCSHEMINQLHKNVVWGLKGNFVGVPTDCPQRDERSAKPLFPHPTPDMEQAGLLW